MTEQHPAEPRRGWRLFVVGRVDGRLYPPFGRSDHPVCRGWEQAVCRTPDEITALGAIWAYDTGPHASPSETCGCGWRVYPDLQAAADGVREMPPAIAEKISGRDVLALVGVDYGGHLAGQHRLNVPDSVDPAVRLMVSSLTNRWYSGDTPIEVSDAWMVSQDERHTIRAEWIRVVGPVYIAPGLARPTRRALRKQYRLTPDALIQAGQRIHPALVAGAITEET